MGPSRPLLRDSGAVQPPPCRGTLAVGGHDAENCVAHHRASICIEKAYHVVRKHASAARFVQRKWAFGAPLSCPNTPPNRVQKDKHAQPRAHPLRERPAEATHTGGRSLTVLDGQKRTVGRGRVGWAEHDQRRPCPIRKWPRCLLKFTNVNLSSLCLRLCLLGSELNFTDVNLSPLCLRLCLLGSELKITIVNLSFTLPAFVAAGK